MRIPKSFKLFGQTITVLWCDVLKGKKSNCLGKAKSSENRIELRKPTEAMPFSKMEMIFWHEAIHTILSSLGERKLSLNESFVRKFAHALYQVLDTMEYEEEDYSI